MLCALGMAMAGTPLVQGQGVDDCNANGYPDWMEADSDGDGVIDTCDVCRDVTNPAQRDTDGDGYGNFCDPDLDNNLIVNVVDLGLFKSVFFTADVDSDFNGDGIVNVLDLGILKSFFFKSPGPGAMLRGESSRPEQSVELAVLSLAPVEAHPVPGETIAVQVVIRTAQGVDPTDPVAQAEVALLSGDELVATQTVGIAADATQQLAFGWTPTSEQETELIAIIGDGGVLERNTTDNTVHRKVIVANAPPPGTDFAVAAVEVISQPDRPYIPLVTVENNGTVTASAPLVVSVNGAPLPAVLTGPVGPGESRQIEFPWPSNVPIEFVQATVNPRFSLQEPVTTDNSSGLNLQDPVDLAVEKLSVSRLLPVDGQPGRATVSFRVRNIGMTTIPATTVTRMTISAVDTTNYVYATPAVAAGATVYFSETVVGNDFDVAVVADTFEVLNEIDRQNNSAFQSYRETGGVDQWSTIGPSVFPIFGGSNGRIWEVAVDRADENTLYVGAPSSNYAKEGGTGVWKTTDGGQSWRPVADSLPSHSIAAIAIDPAVSERVYVATEERGVFRSEDGGTSWIQLTDVNLRPVGHGATGLLIDAANNARLLMRSWNGIYRSVDGGLQWSLVLGGGYARGLLQDQNDPAHIWATITGAMPSQTGVYESFDGGASWSSEPIKGCPGDDLPDSLSEYAAVRIAQSGGRLYISHQRKDSSKVCHNVSVYRSTGTACSIGGQPQLEWEAVWSTDDSTTCQKLWGGLYASPDDPDSVYLMGKDLWYSNNGGQNFSELTQGQPHYDWHDFEFLSDGATVYVGTDGGVYRSSNDALEGTWSFVGKGMNVTEFYDIAIAPTDPALVIGGTQDNGTLTTRGEVDWNHVRGGDGAFNAVDPNNAQVLYSAEQYGDSIKRSSNGGIGFPELLGLPVPANTCFNMPYFSHPATSGVLVAICNGTDQDQGTGDLWRYTDSAGDWQVILPASGVDGEVSAAAIDSSIDLYWAGTTRGEIQVGPGGANWRPVATLSSSKRVSDIEVDPSDTSVLYVAMSGLSGSRVERLKRTSDSPQAADISALDITSNLPTGRYVQAVAVDIRNPNTILAATNRGVYRGRSFDGGIEWAWDLYNHGMPAAVDVVDLEVHPQSGVVRAATAGRGAYRLETNTPIGSVVAIEGRVSLLRVHDVSSGYGPPGDTINGEVVIKLDSYPDNAFGFQLRDDEEAHAHRAMLDVLRSAFREDRRVRIHYVLNDVSNNYELFRVIELF